MKLLQVLIITFLLQAKGQAQSDFLSVIPWECQGIEDDTIYALPLLPNKVEVKVYIDFDTVTGNRMLYTRVTKWNYLSESMTMILDPGEHPLSIYIPSGPGVGHVHLELWPIASEEPSTQTDIWSIINVQNNPIVAFTNHAQSGSTILTTVAASDYNLVNLCGDYQTYVMLEITGSNNEVIARDSLLQEFLGPNPSYNFENEYLGTNTEVCKRAWIRVRNVFENTYTDIETGEVVEECNIEIGLSVGLEEGSTPYRILNRQGVITIYSNTLDDYEQYSSDGKMISSGKTKVGETSLHALPGLNIIVIRGAKFSVFRTTSQ